MPRPWDERSEHRVFHEALEQIEIADRGGIDHVWKVEHHFGSSARIPARAMETIEIQPILADCQRPSQESTTSCGVNATRPALGQDQRRALFQSRL